MRVLITGGTGFIGRQISQKFPSLVITTRDPSRARKIQGLENAEFITWNPASESLHLSVSAEPDAVVNLMGESVGGKRWTAEFRQRLRASRIDATSRLVDGLLLAKKRPRVFVSASAVGYYGDRGDEILTESSSRGDDFLARLCEDWENAARPLSQAGIRVVIIRIGIVLGRTGGALSQMLRPFRWGLGAQLGNGKQFFPWIHERDLVNIFVWAIRSEQVTGVLNGVAPNPSTNQQFTQELAKRLHRPALFRIPRWAIRLLLGQISEAMFASQRVTPIGPLKFGFQYEFPNLNTALEDLLA